MTAGEGEWNPWQSPKAQAEMGALLDLAGCGPDLSMARLISLLRSDFPISRTIRRALVASLEGSESCEIVLKPQWPKAGNPQNIGQRTETHFRNLAIGQYVDVSAKGGKPKDADWRAAEIEYEISKTGARKAYAYWQANGRPRRVERAKN